MVIFFVFFYRARLTIVPTPANAQITLNGQPVTIEKALKLPPGAYTVRLAAEGYLPASQSLRLGVSQIVTLPISLRQIPTLQTLAEGVDFPALTKDQAAIVYLGKNRTQFLKVDTQLGADDKPRIAPITNERFQGVQRVSWSPSRELAVIQTNDGKTQLFDFQRYDLLHQEEKELDASLLATDWHPKLPQIVGYHAPATGERTLLRRDIESGEVTKLIDLRELNLTNPTVHWSPDGRYVALVEQAIYLFDFNTQSVAKLAGSDGAQAATWLPTGATILASFADGLRTITVAGAAQPLNLRTTVDKTAWLGADQILAALSTDQNQDRWLAVNLAHPERRTGYPYTVTGPIDARQLLLGGGDRLWFTSGGRLLSGRLEPDSQPN